MSVKTVTVHTVCTY